MLKQFLLDICIFQFYGKEAICIGTRKMCTRVRWQSYDARSTSWWSFVSHVFKGSRERYIISIPTFFFIKMAHLHVFPWKLVIFWSNLLSLYIKYFNLFKRFSFLLYIKRLVIVRLLSIHWSTCTCMRPKLIKMNMYLACIRPINSGRNYKMYFSLQEKLEGWLYRLREALEKAMTKKQDFHLNTGEYCIFWVSEFGVLVWYMVMYMLCICMKLHTVAWSAMR